jgi:hypothetical protein
MIKGTNRLLFDVILNFMIVLLLLITITTEIQPKVGNIVAEISWPDGWHTDVDIWVKSPIDIVGFKNKSGELFSLLRDDLGRDSVIETANYEFLFSRGVVEGEYVFNVHLFTNSENKFPVPVELSVSVIANDGTKNVIANTTVYLTTLREEQTVARFTLNKQGKILSTNNLPLRFVEGS